MTENRFDDCDEYLAAQRAVRDILYMYRFMTSYRGNLYDDFGFEDGAFDPLTYVDVADDELGTDDVRLLREGSAIKVICSVLQHYSQGGYPQYVSPAIERIRAALDAGRFRYIPELEQVIRLGLESEDSINQRAGDIYRKYVKGYLHDLAASA
jgi:hypothetical protein